MASWSRRFEFERGEGPHEFFSYHLVAGSPAEQAVER